MITHPALGIKKLDSGGIITNYFCNSRCRHCLYRCSNRWPPDFISASQAVDVFQKARQLGCNTFHIGGGEPFLRFRELCAFLELAKINDIGIEHIETNSAWFTHHEKATAMLTTLATLGVKKLLVSISPFHNEFTPFYKVLGVLEACKSCGIEVIKWSDTFFKEITSLDINKYHSLSEYRALFSDQFIESIPERYWISRGGRALEFLKGTWPRLTVAMIRQQGKCGCKELANTSHFHFDLYGNYIPGLCSGLSVKVGDLGKELSPEKYPIITRLYSGGVGNLLRYAMEDFGFEPTRAQYASKCELCHEIRKFLVVHAKLNSHELQPSIHYFEDAL